MFTQTGLPSHRQWLRVGEILAALEPPVGFLLSGLPILSQQTRSLERTGRPHIAPCPPRAGLSPWEQKEAVRMGQ